MPSNVQHDPEAACAAVDDDELVTWWGLVIEGHLVTNGKLMDEIAERFNLAPAPFDILLRLVRTPGCRKPMTQLAREVALSSGGFTKVADRLVAAGLIKREPCDTDRRVTYVTLTPKGRRLAERARAACADILRQRVLAPLGEKRAKELANAMRVLREANSAES